MQRQSSCPTHKLLMCSRALSTPSGDSQKRPVTHTVEIASWNSGKGFLQVEGWVVVLRDRDERGYPKLFSHRLQWQLPQWGAQAAWEKGIQNPGFPTALCIQSGEGPGTWERAFLGGDGSHRCVVEG